MKIKQTDEKLKPYINVVDVDVDDQEKFLHLYRAAKYKTSNAREIFARAMQEDIIQFVDEYISFDQSLKSERQELIMLCFERLVRILDDRNPTQLTAESREEFLQKLFVWCEKDINNLKKQNNMISIESIEDILEDYSNPDRHSIISELSGERKAEQYFAKEQFEYIMNHIFPMLPEKNQEIIKLFYVDGLPIGKIANQLGISHQLAYIRLNKSTEILRKLLTDKSYTLVKDDSIKGLNKLKRFSNTSLALEQYAKEIDFETELVPYLSEDQREVFYKYMLTYEKDSVRKLKEKNMDKDFTSKTEKLIFNKLDLISSRKRKIKALTQKLGGVEGVEDFKLFLHGDELIVFENYIMNPYPDYMEITKAKLGEKPAKSIFGIASFIRNNIVEKIVKRKEKVHEFIEKYGEDFLLNHFAPTLNDTHFIVLTTTLMDYHYSTYVDIEREYGMPKSSVKSSMAIIMKNLDQYVEKINNINDYIEAAGGFENVNEKLVSGLNEKEQTVLFARILSPSPTQLEILAEEFNTTASSILRTEKILESKISELQKIHSKQQGQ